MEKVQRGNFCVIEVRTPLRSTLVDEALDLASRLAAAADAGRVDLSDLGPRLKAPPGSTTFHD